MSSIHLPKLYYRTIHRIKNTQSKWQEDLRKRKGYIERSSRNETKIIQLKGTEERAFEALYITNNSSNNLHSYVLQIQVLHFQYFPVLCLIDTYSYSTLYLF